MCLPYEINSKLWSDGAIAERLLAIPGTGQIGSSEQGIWQFPEGSVLARTISLELEPGKPASRRRVETQVLHLESGAWRPYSYLWNDEPGRRGAGRCRGSHRARSRMAATAGRRERTYRVHARSECVLCHNPWVEKKTTVFGIQSASPLGVNTAQMNKPCASFRGRGATSSRRLHEAGLLAWTPDLAKLPSLVDPYDESADLDRRRDRTCKRIARTATSSTPAARRTSRWDSTFRCRRRRPSAFGRSRGRSASPGPRIIAPGDPARSVLYYRMSKLGGGRMPRVGSNQVDERATRMIHDWIARMPQARLDPVGRGREARAGGSRCD